MTAVGGTDNQRRSVPLVPRGDAVDFLTIYLVFVCAIPSFLVIPALGSFGRLSTVWGLVGLLWWLFQRLQAADRRPSGSHAIRIGVAVFGAAVLLSYGVNVLQGLPPDETSVADAGLLRLCSWLGVALVGLDGIQTRDQLRTLVRRIAIVGVAMAVLGLVQFMTGETWVDRLSLPGFQVSRDLASLQSRAGFHLVAGTAAHPLEYAAVLSAALPISIAAVLPRFTRWPVTSLVPPAVIGTALMLSVSRSALVGLAVGLLLIVPSLTPRARVVAGVAGVGVAMAVALTVPGMIGTIRGLFLGALEDPSTQSRSDGLTPALEIASRDPWVGRGIGTFLPGNLILDNQLLLTLIELGLVGSIALAAVVFLAMGTGFRTLMRSDDPEMRSTGTALAAAIGANVTLLAFFDAFSFFMPGGLLFLCIGLVGALDAMVGQEAPASRLPAVA